MLQQREANLSVKHSWQRQGAAAVAISVGEIPFVFVKRHHLTVVNKQKHTPCLEEEGVLESLLCKNKTKLYNFVHSKCSNPCDVDDLVQDTYLQAMISAKNFSGRSSFSTWLLGIALNLIRNHYNRSPEYKYSMVDSELLHYVESEEVAPDIYRDQEKCLMQLQQEFENLPVLSRDMIIAQVVEGMNYEAIAEHFSVSLSSVKSRLFRAREQLRSNIDTPF